MVTKMSNFEGLYAIRDGTPSDDNFILATFLKGLYYGDSWFSLIPKDLFMVNYKHIVQSLVKSPKVSIKVACLKEDPSIILGYIMMSKDEKTVHWIFIKSIWRKRGIGKSLWPTSATAVSHLSSLGKNLMSKVPNVVFNPFSI
jgi:hypothetical protein